MRRVIHYAFRIADFQVRVMAFSIRNPCDRVDETHGPVKTGKTEFAAYPFTIGTDAPCAIKAVNRPRRAGTFFLRDWHSSWLPPPLAAYRQTNVYNRFNATKLPPLRSHSTRIRLAKRKAFGEVPRENWVGKPTA